MHADQIAIRYRGEYTFGHEVNVFCPAINSQCYWLSGATPEEVRTALRQMVEMQTVNPYEPVCAVIEGAIDRESERRGFAADHDGLITVIRLYGRCDETNVVTQGDLQHHRWILASVNGEALPVDDLDGLIPELDFGEQMRVAGNSGCNRISGTAVLRQTFYTVEGLISTRRFCAAVQNDLERTVLGVLGSESTITLGPDSTLTLEANETTLQFRRQDWIK